MFELQAVSDGKGELLFVDYPFSLIFGIHGAGGNFDIFINKFSQMLLKISQLLITEGSPVSPVDKQHRISSGKISGELQSIVLNGLNFEIRKSFISPQQGYIESGHSFLPGRLTREIVGPSIRAEF